MLPDGNKKTHLHAEEYFFNDRSVFSIGVLSSIPSILVGLGILGTFIGLFFGLNEFRTETTEQLKESINGLLSGMSTAFVTSIWGMGLSILSTIWLRWHLGSVNHNINQLCRTLDSKYKMTRSDEANIENNRIIEVITVHIKPIISDNAEKQTAELKSFFTALADEIKAANENIAERLIEKSQEQTDTLKSLTEKLMANSETIITSLQSLINNIEPLKESIMQKLDDLLIDTDDEQRQILPKARLRIIADNAQEQTAALKSFSTDLADKITVSAEHILSRQNDNIRPLFDKLEKAIEDLRKEKTEGTDEVLKNIIKELQESLKRMIDDLNASLTGSTKQDMSELSNMLKTAGESVKNMASHLEKLDALNDFPSVVEKITNTMLNDFDKFHKNVQDTANQVQSVNKASIEEIKTQVNSIASSFKNTIEDLQNNQEVLITSLNNAIDKNKGASDFMADILAQGIKSLNDAVDKNKELLAQFNSSIKESTEFNNSVKPLHDNLTVVSKQILTLTEDFSKNSQTIKDVSSTLKTSVEALNKRSKDFEQNNEQMISKTNETIKKTHSMANEYIEKFSTIEKGLGTIFEQIKNGINDYKSILTQFNSSMRENTNLNNSVKSLHDNLNKISTDILELSEYFIDSASTIRDTSNTLKTSADSLNTQSKEFTKTTTDTLRSLNETMKQTQKLANDYAEKFSTIESGIGNIFIEIDSGLKGYTQTTGETVNRYLKEYTDNMNKINNLLGNQLASLRESVEDLNDAISKLTKQR
ncbi:hypothetical protein MCHI_002123 [Candidatus Magnetoovum chiemensis]|nr:hypothetical protein MCHI_002123 [Candidatus Magnetoovum chiemensis]